MAYKAKHTGKISRSRSTLEGLGRGMSTMNLDPTKSFEREVQSTLRRRGPDEAWNTVGERMRRTAATAR